MDRNGMDNEWTRRTGPAIELLDDAGRVGIRNLAPAAVLAEGDPSGLSWRVSVESERPEEGCLVARATVTNTGRAPIRLRLIRWGIGSDLGAGLTLLFPSALRPQYYATENFRGDYFAVGTMEGEAFFQPLTNQTVEAGWSEDNLFPGVFVAAESEPIGLVCAQASQERFYPIFRFKGRRGTDEWHFEVDEFPCGLPWLEVAPGESVRGEKLFFHVAATNDPQEATGPYFRLLRRDGLFARAALNPLREQRIYCSWNYDFFADITEESLLAQAPILREHFPSVRFLQLDDGYQHEHAPKQRAMIDLCYGLDEPFDLKKFPSGPRGLADRIKAEGLRPALWLGLWASEGSAMLADHPDWVLHDDAGRPLLFDKWYGGTWLLDPSVAGVREYLDHLARTVFREWGYEGVKLDFSSFAFNAKRVRYRCPGGTAVEMRHELEAIFRRHLPPDGFFGWCVVAGTAQPFLSQADYFRNALDIGHGDWKTARRIANWTANTIALLQERPCLPNIDSIGWSRHFGEAEWRSWLNLCAVSGMAVELSGDLRKLNAQRRRRLARTLELSDPAWRVRCLDLPRGRIEHPPSLWLSEGEEGDAMLAVINWADRAAVVPLGHPCLRAFGGPVRDVWTRTALYRKALPRSVRLGARSSLLLRLGR